MTYCFNCNVEIKASDGHHIYFCNRNSGLTKDQIKKKHIDFNYVTFTREEFIEYYLNKKLSLPDFKKEFGLPFKSTTFLCNYFEVKKRSISEASDKSRIKARDTCLEKYGVENVSQIEKVKTKKEQTFLKNYGVNNIFATDEFKRFLPDRMMELYGTKNLGNRYGGKNKWWAEQSIETRKNYGKKMREGYLQYLKKATGRKSSSKLEETISKILDDIGIGYKQQARVSNRLYDFKLNDKKVLIEIQGDYWHAHPSLFEADDVHPTMKTLARDIWKKDEIKKSLAEQRGYQVIYIWEHEIKKAIVTNDLKDMVEKLIR